MEQQFSEAITENSPKYITEYSPEYVAEVKSHRTKNSMSFGENELAHLDYDLKEKDRDKIYRENNKLSGKEKHTILNTGEVDNPMYRLKYYIAQKIKNLSEYDRVKSDDYGKIGEFLRYALESHDIRWAVAVMLNRIRKDKSLEPLDEQKITIHDLADLFIDIDLIPNGFIKKMAEVHKNKFDKKAEIMEVKFLEIKNDFKIQAFRMIDEGKLPMSKSLVEKRINEYNVIVHDPINKDSFGVGDALSKTISVRIDLTDDELRHTLFHEYVHAIAGLTIVRKVKKSISFIEYEREGLSTAGFLEYEGKVTDFKRRKYLWLTEAVTEIITLELLREDDGNHYMFERAEVLILINAGVPKKMFIDAYFENYSLKNGTPKFDALFAKIKEVMGEEFIEKKGQGIFLMVI